MFRTTFKSCLQLVSVIAMSLAVLCTAHAQHDGVTFHITDFGINQKASNLTIGEDLFKAQNALLDRSDPGVVGIAVPMPSAADMKNMSSSALRAHIGTKVQESVEAAYAIGIRNFEIQIIQNIEDADYLNPARQKSANAFGGTTYAALGDVIKSLEKRGVGVSSYAVVGSNGAAVLAASVESLKYDGGVFLDGVDLIDGRAHIDSTRRLIEAVGPRNVRIFNTHGDLPAPHFAGGFESIAHFSTAIELKDLFPGLKAYLLKPTWQRIDLTKNHIRSMTSQSSTFSIKEYIGNGYMQRVGEGNLSSLELRRQPVYASNTVSRGNSTKAQQGKAGRWVSTLDLTAVRATPQLAPPYAATEFVRVNADRVGEFAAVAFAYANVLDKAHTGALKKIDFFRNNKLSTREKQFLKSGEFVASVFSLSRAVEQDRSENTFGNYTFLRSHTLEGIGRFGLDMFDMLGLKDNAKISKSLGGVLGQVGGYESLLTGLAKHAGGGKLDADITDLYIDGIKSLYKAKLVRTARLKSPFALADGFQELAVTGFRHASTGRMDVDVITGYLDAANNLAWTGLGMSVCSGSYACTKSIQVFGTTLAKALRHSSEPLFSVVLLAKRGQGKKVIDDYMTLQARRMVDGHEVQPITAVYTRDLLKRNGLSDRHIQELDHAALQAAANMATRTASGAGMVQGVATGGQAAVQPTEEDYAGVDLDVGTPRIIETDLSATRQSVLGERP